MAGSARLFSATGWKGNFGVSGVDARTGLIRRGARSFGGGAWVDRLAETVTSRLSVEGRYLTRREGVPGIVLNDNGVAEAGWFLTAEFLKRVQLEPENKSKCTLPLLGTAKIGEGLL